ncbi:MAG: hypothetical protein ACRC42_00045, partial [Mycoplasma sp.]
MSQSEPKSIESNLFRPSSLIQVNEANKISDKTDNCNSQEDTYQDKMYMEHEASIDNHPAKITEEPESIYKKYLVIDDFTLECQKTIIDYICPLCKGVLYNPLADSCQHIFCQSCYETFLSSNKKETVNEESEGDWTRKKENNKGIFCCPITFNDILAYPSKIPLVDSIWSKQNILCKNRNNNCNWIGHLSQLQEHTNIYCNRQVIQCTLKGCNVLIYREDLPQHLGWCDYRIVNCSDCLITLPFINVKPHQEICPKFKLQCPQECSLTIERELMEEHIKNTCSNTWINCPFKKYGCNVELLKKDWDNYLNQNTNKHWILLSQKLDENELQHRKQIQNLEKIWEEEKIWNANWIKNSKHSLPSKSASISNKDLLANKRQRFEEFDEDNLKYNWSQRIEEDDEEIQLNNQQLPSVFDISNIPKGIEIQVNKAKCVNNSKTEHKFVFIKDEINWLFNREDKESYQWTINLNAHSKNSWIACGLCNKDQVLSNKMKLRSMKKSFDHGSFLISVNGFTFNCNNTNENDCWSYSPLLKSQNKTIKIEFTYNWKWKEWLYQIGDIVGKLTEVQPTKSSKSLTPCIVFLSPNDEIEFNIDYEKNFN